MDISTDRSTTRGSRVRAHRRALLALLCALGIAWAPAAAVAGTAKEMSKRGGLGFGSALLTLVYTPLKLAYATGGLLVGALAYGFAGGDREVARVVFTPSLMGDYVVTPAHLSRREPLEFFGRDPAYDPRDVNVAAGPELERESEFDGW